jgi:hypothetical protein
VLQHPRYTQPWTLVPTFCAHVVHFGSIPRGTGSRGETSLSASWGLIFSPLPPTTSTSKPDTRFGPSDTSLVGEPREAVEGELAERPWALATGPLCVCLVACCTTDITYRPEPIDILERKFPHFLSHRTHERIDCEHLGRPHRRHPRPHPSAQLRHRPVFPTDGASAGRE